MLLTGIGSDGHNPVLSHFRGQFPSGDFSLFIRSGQNHTSHGDLDTVNQFSVSRPTPVGPYRQFSRLGVHSLLDNYGKETQHTDPGDQIQSSQKMLRTQNSKNTHPRAVLFMRNNVSTCCRGQVLSGRVFSH